MRSFPVPVLGFLFVSFRPSSLRFPQLFHECFPCAFAFGLFRFPSGSFRPLLFCLRLLGLLCFLSASSCLRLTVASSVLRLRSRFLGFPRSSLPGFPCALSRFPYLAFCSFPFVLPGFAPTAVPPVLPFFSAFASFPGFSLSLRFLSSPSVPVLTTQLICIPFPFFLFPPYSSFFSARLPLSLLTFSPFCPA